MSNALRVLCVAALFVTLSPFALAQSSRSAAPHPDALVKDAVPSSVEVLSTRGGAMVFTSRAAFNNECGSNLTTETFEEANVAPNDADVVGAPLPPEDGVIFPVGSIADGLTITVSSISGLGDDLFVSGAGFFGAPSVQVGNNQNTDKLIHIFNPAVDCAGYDVDLNNTGSATSIEARDASGNVLGSATISGFSLQFVGFKSTGTPISAIVANADVSVEFVDTDNVTFGDVGSTGPLSVSLAAQSSTTVAPGGSVNFQYTVTNNTPNALTGGLFFYAERGGIIRARGQVIAGTLQSGQSVTQSYTQQVPSAAPQGPYDYFVCAGQNINNPVECSDVIVVTVTGSARVASGSQDWTVTDAAPWPQTGELSAAARADAVGAFPNPFARQTQIGFSLEQSAKVSLVVYDVRGREVATLADGTMEAGQHSVTFDAASLPSGVYVYRLVAGAQVETGRLTLVK